jgi:hypothetical protein
MTVKVHESNGKCLFSARSARNSGIQLPRGFAGRNRAGQVTVRSRITANSIEIRAQIEQNQKKDGKLIC